jgi:DNA-binding NtrC family response regulator
VRTNSAQPQTTARSPQHVGVVLVVDDQPSVRIVLSRLLTMYGCASREATCLRDVMAVTEREPIDAFLLDLTLTDGESGLDVLTWLRMQPTHKRTPVLIFTGQAALPRSQETFIRRHGASVVYKTDTLRLAVESVQKLLIDRKTPHDGAKADGADRAS